MPKSKPSPTAYGVIYARYSSHNQREESIEQQVEECSAFAKANGIEIIQIYADKAISGRSDKRPQFQRMLRDAERKEFSVVIAYKSNRIARNMLNALQTEARLDLFGIRTLYAKEEFGNTAAGRFALRTMMNVNQFYSENMAEDIKRGMADNAANCKVNGSLPLGYVKGPDGRYAISPAEASIVREIFDRYLDGVTLIDIARDLNRRGVKTKLGRDWNKNSFHRMLVNDAYIGIYRHSGFVIEDGIPPIITKEVFTAVQKKLVTKPHAMGRHHEYGDYLLTGKLFCGHCKSHMVGVSGKTRNGKPSYFYYQCQKRRMEKACDKKNIGRDYVETAVARATQSFIGSDEVLNWVAENAVKLYDSSRSRINVSSIDKDIARAKSSIKNIMSAIEQGIFTESTKDRLLELEANIKELESTKLLVNTDDDPFEKDRLVYSLKQLRTGDPESKEYQKILIDTFVKAVYLWDDKIEVDYYYPGKRRRVTIPISDDSGPDDPDGPLCEVRTSSLGGHHRRVIRTADGSEAVIILAPEHFAVLCPLFML